MHYSTHDFHSSEAIQSTLTDKSFSALHLNIRSLAANFDSLCLTLNELNHCFSVIGLSETKIIQGHDPFVNTCLSNDDFVSQPTLSNAGGVGFFIKADLNYSKREDLSQSQSEFESLWGRN